MGVVWFYSDTVDPDIIIFIWSEEQWKYLSNS